MAEMSSSNQLAVQMPSTLEAIKISMNTMVSSMAAAQTAINTGFNTTQAVAMRQAVSNVSVELTRYREGLERINQTPVKAPEPPTWNSVASEPVFMNSGAGRFEQEYQAAATAAQQLYKNQLGISAQARRMRVVPPGMLNDVAATSVRVQSLSHRIEKLNSIPVNLRTDKVNNELETLRGKLSQAATVQGQLSSAMSRMDISASNAAYQELNSIMDSAERDIRNNNLEAAKKSSSDGKTAVAAAITQMGVSTAANVTFATMANNVKKISRMKTKTGSISTSGSATFITVVNESLNRQVINLTSIGFTPKMFWFYSHADGKATLWRGGDVICVGDGNDSRSYKDSNNSNIIISATQIKIPTNYSGTHYYAVAGY